MQPELSQEQPVGALNPIIGLISKYLLFPESQRKVVKIILNDPITPPKGLEHGKDRSLRKPYWWGFAFFFVGKVVTADTFFLMAIMTP